MTKSVKIKDFPEYYITDNGEVYSRKTKRSPCRRIKKLISHIRAGYLSVILTKEQKHYNKHIHRLVAEAFISNPKKLPCVNHKNGIKTDNRVENLEWVTISENMKHAYRVLHINKPKGMSGKLGKENKKSKVIQQIKDNVVIAEFYGCGEAMRKTGINYSNICKCCRKERPFAGGYNWKYK